MKEIIKKSLEEIEQSCPVYRLEQASTIDGFIAEVQRWVWWSAQKRFAERLLSVEQARAQEQDAQRAAEAEKQSPLRRTAPKGARPIE